MQTIYTDSNGTAWYINAFDLFDMNKIFRATVSDWVNTDIDPWERNGKVDAVYYPLQADDEEQLEARKDTLKDGMMGNVRVKGKRGGLHTTHQSV